MSSMDVKVFTEETAVDIDSTKIVVSSEPEVQVITVGVMTYGAAGTSRT